MLEKPIRALVISAIILPLTCKQLRRTIDLEGRVLKDGVRKVVIDRRLALAAFGPLLRS